MSGGGGGGDSSRYTRWDTKISNLLLANKKKILTFLRVKTSKRKSEEKVLVGARISGGDEGKHSESFGGTMTPSPQVPGWS